MLKKIVSVGHRNGVPERSSGVVQGVLQFLRTIRGAALLGTDVEVEARTETSFDVKVWPENRAGGPTYFEVAVKERH